MGPQPKDATTTNATATELPVAFRAPRTLQALSIVATATSLGALAGSSLSYLLFNFGAAGAISAITTTVCALLWATLLRHRSTPGAVAASVLLAAANAGVAFFVTTCLSEHAWNEAAVIGAMYASTFGAILWLPCLFVAWLIFGYPLLRAKRAAERGVGSEDRGERVVASVAIGTAITALAIPYIFHTPAGYDDSTVTNAQVTFAAAVVALVAGLSAVSLATRRERARKTFVQSIKAGERDGFRVEIKENGQEILLRVRLAGEGYRVAPMFEELVDVSDEASALARGAKTPRVVSR